MAIGPAFKEARRYPRYARSSAIQARLVAHECVESLKLRQLYPRGAGDAQARDAQQQRQRQRHVAQR